MPRRRERTQYQQVSSCERGRMVGVQEAGLSYHDMAAHTGHAANSYSCKEPMEREGRTQRRVGTGSRNVTQHRMTAILSAWP